MPLRVYLDNCAFNRPFDDCSIERNRLERSAKLNIQDRIRSSGLELVWSYILEFEIDMSPYQERREQIFSWRAFSVEIILNSPVVDQISQDLVSSGLRPKDSLHIACAIAGGSEFFITTDDRILNKQFLLPSLRLLNPVDFVLL